MKKAAILLAALVLLAMAASPFVVIHYMRSHTSTLPRIHLVHDMDHQEKYKTQSLHPAFADHRTMRPPVEGTVSVDQPPPADLFLTGIQDNDWTSGFPHAAPLSSDSVVRGRDRYMIYCLPCHGSEAAGDGMVAKAAERLDEASWVQPPSLLSPDVKARPAGHLYNTVTNGIRSMPAYRSQIPTADRWAIVAYLQAIQGRHPHLLPQDM